MVGSPPAGEAIPVDGRLLFSDRKLMGCLGGGNIPQRDIPRLMGFLANGSLRLEPLISQRLRLDQVNEAFDALRKGELARSVIVF